MVRKIAAETVRCCTIAGRAINKVIKSKAPPIIIMIIIIIIIIIIISLV